MDEAYYIRIWISSLKKFDVSLLEAALMTLILNLSVKSGYCWASKKKLGEILNVSKVTIHFHLKRLQARGLLETVEPTMNVPTSCFKVSDTWKEHVEDLVERARDNQWESFSGSPF